MQIAIAGMTMMMICHETCVITAIIPKSCIVENANDPTWYGIFKSTADWSVEACGRKEQLSTTSKLKLLDALM